jgi:hypothetical protein
VLLLALSGCKPLEWNSKDSRLALKSGTKISQVSVAVYPDEEPLVILCDMNLKRPPSKFIDTRTYCSVLLPINEDILYDESSLAKIDSICSIVSNIGLLRNLRLTDTIIGLHSYDPNELIEGVVESPIHLSDLMEPLTVYDIELQLHGLAVPKNSTFVIRFRTDYKGMVLNSCAFWTPTMIQGKPQSVKNL